MTDAPVQDSAAQDTSAPSGPAPPPEPTDPPPEPVSRVDEGVGGDGIAGIIGSYEQRAHLT